jgi:KaiC/GvpD/RAD55 family RecA-like ATPase
MTLLQYLLKLLNNDGSVSLGTMLRKGTAPPAILPGGCLYAGRTHGLASFPEIGKTTLSMLWMREIINADMPVIYLDWENTASGTADRMSALGFSPEKVDRYMHYFPFPDRTWLNEDDQAWLDKLLRKIRPALVVIDSMTDLLSAASVSESSPTGITGIWRDVFGPMTRRGSAVLILDHLAKAAKSDERSPRSSGAKLAKCDVQMRLDRENGESFNRDRGAVITLRLTKDRWGCLRPPPRWRVEVEDGQMTITPEQGGTDND